MTGSILRLYPLPAERLPGEGVYEDLELPPPGRRETTRPYVIINMVSSVDGKTTVEGGSSGLGDQTDRQAMRILRSKADAVMIGAGTLRAEKLSLGLDDPSIPQPLAVIATRAGNVPFNNLIAGERQKVLVITTQEAQEDLDDRLRESACVLRVSATPSGAIEVREALEVLKTEHAVDLLLVEGGPRFNHALISSNLADELFLTLAPKMVGGTPGDPFTIVNGPALAARDINLLSVHLAADEIFLRYALHRHN